MLILKKYLMPKLSIGHEGKREGLGVINDDVGSRESH